jgi:hypothetical protein
MNSYQAQIQKKGGGGGEKITCDTTKCISLSGRTHKRRWGRFDVLCLGERMRVRRLEINSTRIRLSRIKTRRGGVRYDSVRDSGAKDSRVGLLCARACVRITLLLQTHATNALAHEPLQVVCVFHFGHPCILLIQSYSLYNCKYDRFHVLARNNRSSKKVARIKEMKIK